MDRLDVLLKAPADEQVIGATKHDVAELAEQFPVPASKLDAEKFETAAR